MVHRALSIEVYSARNRKFELSALTETYGVLEQYRAPSSVSHHGDEASDELEVHEVVGVDLRGRVDLQAVVVLVGVLEHPVHRVQQLVGQHEEPLAVA